MADLVVGLAKTVLEGALTKAQSTIEEESKLQQSVQHNLVFIAGELETMHSFLIVANEERVKNKVVRTWVRQVRDLAVCHPPGQQVKLVAPHAATLLGSISIALRRGGH